MLSQIIFGLKLKLKAIDRIVLKLLNSEFIDHADYGLIKELKKIKELSK